MSEESIAEQARVPLVAVVGVHGVGAHAAGETENSMVDLLMSLPAGEPNAARYFEAFEMVGLQIPLQPVGEVVPDPTPKKSLFNLYEERSVVFAKKTTKDVQALKEAKPKRGVVGIGYTASILEGYQGGAEGDVYVTTRLEGARREVQQKCGAAKVHVYEVLWADLARPDNTILSFFVALFQLLLHLASLSQIVVDTGSAENRGPLWAVYSTAQRYAVRMLQIFLPLLKIIFLIAVLAIVPGAIDRPAPNASKTVPSTIHPCGPGAVDHCAQNSGTSSLTGLISPLLAGLGVMVLTFLLLRMRRKPVTVNPWLWSLLALVPAAAGAVAGWLLAYKVGADRASALVIWIFVGAPLLAFILSKYKEIRAGVAGTGAVLFVASFATFAYFLFGHPAVGMNASVTQATFWLAELLAASIRLSWVGLIGFAFLALVSGSLASMLEGDRGKKARARAAVRTSRFALALPSVLFLIVTSLISGATYYATRKFAPGAFSSELCNQLPFLSWLIRHSLIPDPSHLDFSGDYFKSLLVWEVGYQFPLTLALFFLSIFLLIWWALPGVVTEKLPLRQEKEPPRSSTNAESVRLGSWLSRGLDATSVVTFLAWSSIFLAPPLFYLISFVWPKAAEILVCCTQWIITNPGLAISGPVLAAAVKYGSPILSTVLDVDTYLRTTPEKEPPRAKIIERYTSTLRYVGNYRDAEGRPYDSVIIVAHSLGALISGDLLLYLNSKGKLRDLGFATGESPDGIPIKLFTMGNPTRQLLNRFFPYLYDWVRDEPDNGLRPLPDPATAPPTMNPTPENLPDPKDLGVERWVNAYRSGDYVGRSLWLNEWYDRTSSGDGRYPQKIYKATDGMRTEMCIGAGAHTHYWDDTAPDIAEELNLLI